MPNHIIGPVIGSRVLAAHGTAAAPVTVFALAGQSNGAPRNTFDGGDDFPTDGSALQVGRASAPFTSNADNAIVDAVRPLDAWTQYGKPGFNYPLQFTLDWLAANPGRKILLVPGNKSATGFDEGHWTVGGVEYEDLLARTLLVLSNNPSHTLGGLLWNLGERDSARNMTGAAFAAALDASIADFRTRTGSPDLPVIVSRMLDVHTTGTAADIKAALADTPNRVAYSAFADPAGLTDVGDDLHFDAASARTLGSRYFTALSAAAANVPPPDAVELLAQDHRHTEDNGATHTFSGMTTATGTAVVAVSTVGGFGSAPTVDAVSVGGVAATKVPGSEYADALSGTISFWTVDVTGTANDVEVSFSASMSRKTCQIWSLTGGAVAGDADISGQPSASTALTLDVPAGAMVLAAQMARGINSTTSFTFGSGSDVGTDTSENPANNVTYAGAAQAYASPAPGETITATVATAPAAGNISAVALTI